MKKLNWTKNRKIRLMTRTAAALLVLLLAAGLTGCGGSGKEEQQTVTEETAAVEAAATEEKEPAAEAPAEQTVAEEVKAEETTPEVTEAEEVKPEEVKTEEPAQQVPEKPQAAEEAKQEPESIQKPVPTEEPKKEEKKEEKKEKKTSAPGLKLLDGVMTFDGIEVEFPIELSGMKLGNWKIEYQDVDNPDDKVLAPGEIVTGVMTNSAYSEDDVTAIAEFGNYSNEDVSLTDLPMTGIYLTKGKGKDGEEPKLPEVVMPGGLTWGSSEAEVRELFGEASLSGTFFDKDFDYMYENGDYMVEFGGMNDTGLEYIVYCVE